MAFSTLSGAAVPVFNLAENIRSKNISPGGRPRLNDHRRRSWAGITAARNHGIGIENIVEDTNIIFTRTKIQHLTVVRAEWPEAGVVVVVMTKADGVADLVGEK